MKKLKKSLNTLSKLSRDDMRQIVGGYGEQTPCNMYCNTNHYPPNFPATGTPIAVPVCSAQMAQAVCQSTSNYYCSC